MGEPKRSSPLQAIRKYCRMCRIAYVGTPVRDCPLKTCELWPFRLTSRLPMVDEDY